MKERIRWLMLWSSVPPLRQLYAALYRLIGRAAGWWIARDGRVASVFYRRGMAKGEALPGISDIDIGVIVHDGVDPMAYRAQYAARFQRFPIIDRYCSAVCWSELPKLYAGRLRWRYSLLEAQATLILLHGRHPCEAMPALSPAEWTAPLLAELDVWWGQTVRGLYGEAAPRRSVEYVPPPPPRQDGPGLRALCWKCVCEVLRLATPLWGGELSVRRIGAFRRARPFLTEAEAAFVARLEELERARFLRPWPTLPEETHRFVVAYLDRVQAAVAALPLAQPRDRTPPPRVDFVAAECFPDPQERQRLEELCTWLEGHWPGLVGGVYLTPSLFRELHEALLLLEATPARLPTLEQVRTMRQAAADAEAELPRDVHVTLLLPHCLLHLGPRPASDMGWESVLGRAFAADLPALLARPECVLRGEPIPATPAPGHTEVLDWLIRGEQLRWETMMGRQTGPAARPLDLCRAFWNGARAAVLARSSQAGQLILPMSLPAVRRAVAKLGYPMPEELAPLEPAYAAALRGEPLDLGDLVAPAKHYLREIEIRDW